MSYQHTEGIGATGLARRPAHPTTVLWQNARVDSLLKSEVNQTSNTLHSSSPPLCVVPDARFSQLSTSAITA